MKPHPNSNIQFKLKWKIKYKYNMGTKKHISNPKPSEHVMLHFK